MEEEEEEIVKEDEWEWECGKCGCNRYRHSGPCKACLACGTTDGGCG